MKTGFETFRTYCERTFAIDLRCLNFLRVALGVIILFDAFELLKIYKFLIGKSSLITLQMAVHEGEFYRVAASKLLAFLNPSADILLQNFILILMLLGSILLILRKGVLCAQITLIFCYLFIFWRWPHFTHDGDYLVIWTLLWISFLPNNRGFEKRYYFSSATVAVYVQVILFFIVAGLNKNGSFWLEGSAVGLAFQQRNMTTYLGMHLVPGPLLSKILTYSTLFAEVVCPLLLALPFANWILKKISLTFLTITMFGIVLVFHTGNMAPVALVLLLPIAGFPKNEEFVRTDVSFPTWKSFLLGSFGLMGFLSCLYNLSILPSEISKAVEPYAIGAKIPLKQSWKMYSRNPPDSVVAIRFFDIVGNIRTYRNFFTLEQVLTEKYYDDLDWYDLNIRYRRFQKYFERVYLKRGLYLETFQALNQSLCSRLGSGDREVGAELWIKVLAPQVSYRVVPLSPDIVKCYNDNKE